jgi:two-component system response regulator DesR
MVRVLLGHGWRLFREALSVALTQEASGLQVVAEAADGEELLEHARRSRPDVVVVDVTLPAPAGIQALCQSICDALPECGVLVILDRYQNAKAGLPLARLAPRVGLLGTDASPTELIQAVRQMAEGHVVLDARVAVAALTAGENPLTERECEVLRLAINGLPTKEIARTLHLSAGTIRNCMSRVLAKTGARTRIEAMRVAQTSGWI